jgi:hypothetical protein
MVITAGIAAASIMRHGIAAHTSSAAKCCRRVLSAAGARRVLQIERNIALNTPAASSAHIPSMTSRTSVNPDASSTQCSRGLGVLFYFFWELMLVPMYFLIALWGHERRIYAAIKFFL